MRFQPRIKALTASTLIAALVMGCAQLPTEDLQRLSQIQIPEPSTPSQGRGNQLWPTDMWWKQYKDEQLNALIEQALEKSPDMTITQARIAQAQAASGISQSTAMPQVNANVALTAQQQSANYLFPANMIPKGWESYGQSTLGFQWDLDFWGLHKAQIAAATSDLLAAQAERSQAKLTLASAIASQYTELARLYEAQDNAQERLALRQRYDHLVTLRIKQGLELSSTLNQTKSQTLQIESEIIETREQIEATKRQLVVLAGGDLNQASQITRPHLQLQTEVNLPENLSLSLLGRRPDLVAARMQVQGQLKRIDQTKASFYPDINLSGYVGYQSFHIDRLITDGSHFGSVGPALTLPIFTANRLQNELRFGIAKYEEAVATYDKTFRQSLQEVSDSAAGLQSANDQKQKIGHILSERKSALNTVRQRQRAGLNNEMDVLLSQENVLFIQKNLSDINARSIAMDIKLKHALGGGYQTATN